MDEISVVMHQFQSALKTVIDAEIRRQVSDMIGTSTLALPVEEKKAAKADDKRRGPKVGTIAQAKPCPTCGELNKARRWRFYCAAHRS